MQDEEPIDESVTERSGPSHRSRSLPDLDKAEAPENGGAMPHRSLSLSSPSSTQEQHYQDDLRAGAFQFVDAATKDDDLPLPYQVVFWEDPPTMTWRYPQPRALTRVDIFPVPFVLASDSSSTWNEVSKDQVKWWSKYCCCSYYIPYSPLPFLVHLYEYQ